MYWLYSALLAIALLVGLPYWLWHLARHGKYVTALPERLGFVPRRLLGGARQPSIWVHAVSVGEVLAVDHLARRLRASLPDYRVLVSTTTDTGQKLARSRFGDENVFYFPLDFAFAVRSYLNVIRPELVVIAETEFWPNFLRLARANGARIAVVNARISDRSLPGYRRLRDVFNRILDNVDLFLTQTQEDRRRLIEIGARIDRVQVGGNLKFDSPTPEETPLVANLRSAFHNSDAQPVLVCGSTMEGEEALLLRAFENVRASYAKSVMVLAPRHPERFQKVADLIARLGIPLWRRSQWKGETLAGGVFLLDSIGELAAAYSLADIASVGGSLVFHGGHNILEPAQFGVPIVTGNSYENFRDVVRLFLSSDAVRIVGPAELPLVFMDLANRPEERHALGRRAARALEEHKGTTERTLDALLRLLQQDKEPAEGGSRR
jgi:3-deoxy-D-manno-octulosonic-acid transferase